MPFFTNEQKSVTWFYCLISYKSDFCVHINLIFFHNCGRPTRQTGSGTRYTARCLHKNGEDRKKHEEMGFFDGWGTMIQQMEEVARSL